MAIGDDFSFPKLTNTNTCNNSPSQFSLSSQSMWRISSLVYPHNAEDYFDDDDDDNNEEERRELPRKHKSFSEFEIGDSEARMDLLWQDFNERELKRVSSLDSRIKSRNLSRSESTRVVVDYSGGSDRRLLQNLPDRVQARFAPGSNNSRGSGKRSSLVRSRKRTSTVVFLRALRKLFFVHNYGRGSDKNNV